MKKLDDQLKDAITRMSVKEKDKLLLRLVAKDEKLVRKLIFELLEGGQTRDDRAAELRENIETNLSEASDLTPGYLLLYLRHWNARITEHVQATKDKSGEVTLTFFLLAEALRRHGDMVLKFPPRRSETLAPYLVKRTQSLLNKAQKLHEDYHIEFRSNADEVLQFIWAFAPTAKLATQAALPRKSGF
jgi:hypothetical protein